MVFRLWKQFYSRMVVYILPPTKQSLGRWGRTAEQWESDHRKYIQTYDHCGCERQPRE